MITATALRGPGNTQYRSPYRTPPTQFQPYHTPAAPLSKRLLSVFAPWASASAYGLCVNPVTGQTMNATTGSPADVGYGGLAPGTQTGLPLCPQPPTATQPTGTTANPPPAAGVVNASNTAAAPGAETPDATVWAPVTPPRPKWLPWAIGGGILAAVGAAAIALTQR